MNKKISFLLVILIILSFTGCGIKELNEDNNYVVDLSQKIVKCFDEKDSKTLMEMFCLNSQNYYDLDAQIQDAFDLYEGKSKSFNVDLQGGWAGGKDNGEWTDKHFNPIIKNIETEEKKYSIGYCTYTVYKYDNAMVGIGVISLEDQDGNILSVIGGYDWY